MNRLKLERRVGRPSDPSLVLRVLDAGWRMFLERGVEAVPLEAIASAAGVSKATLYRYFPDKTALFEATIHREMQRIEAAQGIEAHGRQPLKVGERLRVFGIGLMNFLAAPDAVNFYKTLSGELSRHPVLAKRFYELGPGRTRENLAAMLAAAAAAGELDIPDPQLAAEHLIGLWQGLSNFQLSLGLWTQEVRDAIPERVDAGVRVFLSAYRPGNARAEPPG